MKFFFIKKLLIIDHLNKSFNITVQENKVQIYQKIIDLFRTTFSILVFISFTIQLYLLSEIRFHAYVAYKVKKIIKTGNTHSDFPTWKCGEGTRWSRRRKKLKRRPCCCGTWSRTTTRATSGPATSKVAGRPSTPGRKRPSSPLRAQGWLCKLFYLN